MEGFAEIISGAELLDKKLTLAVNLSGGGFTDALMPLLSNRLLWAPFYLLLIYFLWKRLGWKKMLLVLLSAIICVGATDQLANLVKQAVQRLRPCWDSYMLDGGLKVLERNGSRFGFFSAHAATLSAISTVILFFLRRWDAASSRGLVAGILVFWVAAVSISRVYVGKHFLGDIIAGALAGIIIVWILSLAVHWVINKFFAKFVD